MNSKPRRVIILGAAGRDFHNFNVFFRDQSAYDVKAFTAFQIPNIDDRTYPPLLAGSLYPQGIPIFPEAEMERLITEHKINEVVFAYSDVSNEYVMERAARANSAGADFTLMGPRATMLRSSKPVISVCAVRTGCGKSQTTRALANILKQKGLRAAVIRHPMPYGDLLEQRVQRFASIADLDRYHCTVEEREEYELHIAEGHLLYAGVDYEAILRNAEKEADVILWDGGNNDLPFYWPDLHIVLLDPHRAGDELKYYPSMTNLQLANVLIIAKSGTAPDGGIEKVQQSAARYNPRAALLKADSIVQVNNGEALRGKKALVIEDGPTLTHGGMSYGAGTVAARQYGVGQMADPRPYAVGTIKKTFASFPHLTNVLPAMGYSEAQLADLKATIEGTPCEVVLVGTPFNLASVLGEVGHPIVRATYELDGATTLKLGDLVDEFLKKR